MDKLVWNVDVVLSHTTTLKYELVEVFIAEVDQSKADKSTEEWMGMRIDWTMESGIVGIIIRRRRLIGR